MAGMEHCARPPSPLPRPEIERYAFGQTHRPHTCRGITACSIIEALLFRWVRCPEPCTLAVSSGRTSRSVRATFRALVHGRSFPGVAMPRLTTLALLFAGVCVLGPGNAGGQPPCVNLNVAGVYSGAAF